MAPESLCSSDGDRTPFAARGKLRAGPTGWDIVDLEPATITMRGVLRVIQRYPPLRPFRARPARLRRRQLRGMAVGGRRGELDPLAHPHPRHGAVPQSRQNGAAPREERRQIPGDVVLRRRPIASRRHRCEHVLSRRRHGCSPADQGLVGRAGDLERTWCTWWTPWTVRNAHQVHTVHRRRGAALLKFCSRRFIPANPGVGPSVWPVRGRSGPG